VRREEAPSSWEGIGLEGEGSDEGGELESSGGVRCTCPRGEVCGYPSPTAGRGEEVDGGANMPLDIRRSIFVAEEKR
jgi:hypothetical protein